MPTPSPVTLADILAADLSLVSIHLVNAQGALQLPTLSAVATTLTQTAAPTIEAATAAAQSAVAPAITKLVSDAGPVAGPIAQWAADAYMQGAVTNFFNFLIGRVGGTSAETAAQATESANGL